MQIYLSSSTEVMLVTDRLIEVYIEFKSSIPHPTHPPRKQIVFLELNDQLITTKTILTTWLVARQLSLQPIQVWRMNLNPKSECEGLK